MRVESPANFPVISTHKANNMHPHQSIFYDKQTDIDEDRQNNPGKYKTNAEFNLPELFSMKMNKKIYNNRLSNEPENLGNLTIGIKKDINELSQVILSLEKYGNTAHALKNHVLDERQ